MVCSLEGSQFSDAEETALQHCTSFYDVHTVKIYTANKEYSCRLFTNGSNSRKMLKLATNSQHHARQTD
jgi:hypothetical protein